MKCVLFMISLQGHSKENSRIIANENYHFHGILIMLHYFKYNEIDMHHWDGEQYAYKCLFQFVCLIKLKQTNSCSCKIILTNYFYSPINHLELYGSRNILKFN